MKKIITAIFLVTFLLTVIIVRADELDDITKQLDDLNRAREMSIKATTPLEQDVTKLTTQLNNIITKVYVVEKEIVRKEAEVVKSEEILSHQQKLLEARTQTYYKNINKSTTSLIDLLVSNDFSQSLNNFFYQKHLMDEDKKNIIQIVVYIKDLEDKKKTLENEKVRLAAIKLEVDKQNEFLKGEIAKAKKYQAELANTIAQLSVRQQQLIAQKLAALNISRSAQSVGRCDNDLTNGRDPDFSPRLAFFTYGVPNRVGLNQYGALGRSKSGQNYEQILRVYYNFDNLQDYDVNKQINVESYGNFSLEEYTKRIYEVPSSWGDEGGMEALKAQAIAARSYALAYTNNGAGSICTTEYCQVFKPEPKGGNWERAVNETSGKVMVQGGNPIKAWFSSTHGGYIRTSGEIGWSDTGWTKHANDFDGSVSSFDDLKNKAYDRDSPWFYCDWGYRAQYNKTAWLKPDELADIVNTIILAKRDSSVQEHLYQTDSPPAGTDTWSTDRVKSELRSRGGNPFNNVSDVSVSADFGSGRTTTVNVSGDAGSQSFDGGEFKNFFNLRAPANIQIVGPLYNVEKR